jgi:hypothetical protein
MGLTEILDLGYVTGWILNHFFRIRAARLYNPTLYFQPQCHLLRVLMMDIIKLTPDSLTRARYASSDLT